ncbi:MULTISPECIES: ComF family protein [unclassified Curtobacterium]|uniref:ComF family protein n=1 Tax=unclassified Curtobacterium TaxID=257496 RepID=UPI0038220675
MTSAAHPWRDAFLAVLALFLPVSCLGCGAVDRALCDSCRAELADRPGRVRLVGGVRLDAAFEYEGLVRTLVLELKLRGRLDVAAPLGRPTGALVRAALADAPPGTLVLRVPPSPRGRRRRGFDTVVVLLARGGVRRTGRLRRLPGSRGAGQKERTALERVDATVGTLRAVGVAGRSVVLVDDVVTTGVTMAEAVRAVRAAGGRVVRCIATASVES